jgi:very-short-patch-repair endonuclease/predicted transcriptional regulator of viral defense system
MTPVTLHSLAWALAQRQHWVVTHAQLVELGFTEEAIRWRLAEGRLHRVHRGVYAVGRPQLSQAGRFMAAVMRCGGDACLSHISAGAHWKLRPSPPSASIHISLLAAVFRQPPGIKTHRRPNLPPEDVTVHDGIPITTPTRTLIDLALTLGPHQLEAAVNEADSLDLIDPESLRAELDKREGQPGVRPLRTLLDRHTFRLTESELERRFLRIVRDAGLPLPDTQEQLAGRTDFHWPALNLVVETDGWRYHRTPARQARDNRRMQRHAMSGRTALRFSHYEVRFEASRVEVTLKALARRLAATASA